MVIGRVRPRVFAKILENSLGGVLRRREGWPLLYMLYHPTKASFMPWGVFNLTTFSQVVLARFMLGEQQTCQADLLQAWRRWRTRPCDVVECGGRDSRNSYFKAGLYVACYVAPPSLEGWGLAIGLASEGPLVSTQCKDPEIACVANPFVQSFGQDWRPPLRFLCTVKLDVKSQAMKTETGRTGTSKKYA